GEVVRLEIEALRALVASRDLGFGEGPKRRPLSEGAVPERQLAHARSTRAMYASTSNFRAAPEALIGRMKPSTGRSGGHGRSCLPQMAQAIPASPFGSRPASTPRAFSSTSA